MPTLAFAHNNLGAVFFQLGRHSDAVTSYKTALSLHPAGAEIHRNLGNSLTALGLFREAEDCYRQAIALKQDDALAHFCLGQTLLRSARYTEGWPELEWRRFLMVGRPELTQPLWQGEAICGQTLLLYAEQGLGDTIQFSRYVRQLSPGIRCILEAPQPLARLLAKLGGIEQIVIRGDDLPHFDFQLPLLSLPYLLGTTETTIPAQTPYLFADPDRGASWRLRLEGVNKLRKIGLCWAGNRQYALGRARDIPPEKFQTLNGVSGISFVSLQKEAELVPDIVACNWTDELTDFDDTAALVGELDLVITVDTAVAHLAGALGKPVWLLNRYNTCWRWLLNRSDSPWYPTLRQFRQRAPGDWDGVLSDVRSALIEWMAG